MTQKEEYKQQNINSVGVVRRCDQKDKGITLIALIITIILMLILLVVTINIVINGGLIGTASKARQDTEKHSIYEQIVAMSEWDNYGHIKVAETFNTVKGSFTVTDEKWNTARTEVSFKVEGKYGKYSYKITKTEIILASEENTSTTEGDLYFTFNGINNAIKDYIRTMLQQESQEEVTDALVEETLNQLLPEIIEIQEMGEKWTGTLSVLGMPSELFWPIVGKNLTGQYGINGETLSLLNAEHTMSSPDIEEGSDMLIFTEFHASSTNNSTNMFLFLEDGDTIMIALSKVGEKVGEEFEAILSADGKDLSGTASETIMSWEEFLQAYGDTKFYFDGSENAKESYYVDIGGNGLDSYEDTIAYEGDTFEYTFIAQDGYALPNEITVEKDGEELQAGIDYTWDKLTGKLTIMQVTGSLRIRVYAESTTVYIYKNCNNVTSNGGSWQDTATKGNEYTNIFIPDENYILPETIKITNNYGTELQAGIDYTWDSATGNLTIFSVTESLNIEITGLDSIVSVWVRGYNTTYNDIDSSNLDNGVSYINTFIAVEGYVLPETITIINNYGSELQEGVDYTWDSTTGELIIHKVTRSLSVVVESRKNTIKYVRYDNKLWIVLYEEGELGQGYGAQIISTEVLEGISLDFMGSSVADDQVQDLDGDGNLWLEKAMYSYDNAITILNDTCINLVTQTAGITTGIRCAGSNPTNPNSESGLLINSGETLESWYTETYASCGKASDENYINDYEKLNQLGIRSTGNSNGYWLASRYVALWDTSYWFCVRSINEYAELRDTSSGTGNGLITMESSSRGVRPVVMLETGVLKSATGTGTIEDPFVLN